MPRRTERGEARTVETDTPLSRREATLRSAATTCLAGIALLQAIELPSLFAQGRQLAVLSIAAMGLCIGLGLALAAAPAGAARQLWRVVAGTAVLVLAGWAVLRAFTIPGLDGDRGDWTAMPGLACAALAAGCLMLAVAAVPPTRREARGLAVALAVSVALAPVVGMLLVGLGPGTAGGETVLASGGHLHSHGSPESSIVYQPLPGGHGGHYVYRAVTRPHQTALGAGLIVAAAFVFTYGAVGYLRRRTAPLEPIAVSGLETGLAA
jgi:hypothetical protein